MQRQFRKALFASSVLIAAAAASPVLAQAPATGTNGGALLGEIVVTATRQADTVNRVPITVSAQSQQSLDQQGVKRIDDLGRTTPALAVTRAGATGDVSINIRGIISNVAGTSPTAGVYLDDVPLTKRSPGTGFQVGLGGPPIPQLFDLERVEVLFGPQGTLYGGSSQGGNIRFITPDPSLTRYSSYARAELSSTEHGSRSYEAGLAVGGPIVEDKLGFRMSVWGRHTGGYIDHINLYTSKVIAKDTNFGDAKTVRLAFQWKPTEKLRLTPSVLWTSDRTNDVDQSWEDIPQYFTRTFTVASAPTTVNGVPIASITAPGVPNTPQRRWTFNGFTDGPYNQFGPYTSGTNYYATEGDAGAIAGKTPRVTRLFVPSLSFDYDLGEVQVHNTLAYVQDRTSGYQFGRVSNSTVVSNVLLAQGNVGDCGIVTNNQVPALTLTNGCYPIRLPGFPQLYQQFSTFNHRRAITEELRFSSDPTKRFSFVAGIFYTSGQIHAVQRNHSNTADAFSFITGGNYEGFVTTIPYIGPYNQTNLSNTIIKEREIAAFGEANFKITEKLKLTAGVRVSNYDLKYAQETGGQVTGVPQGFVGTPANPFPLDFSKCPATLEAYNPQQSGNGCPFTYTLSSTNESPVTPKIGLSYQANPESLYYVTASKGYRPGGINPPVSPVLCEASFRALGITSTPTTFDSDTLWNYEAGAKLRLFRRAQLNTSAFYIEWKNLPFAVSVGPPCNRSYTANAGSAVSKGFSTQFQYRVIGGLQLAGALAYTDAYYTSDLRSPFAGAPRIITKGEPITGNSKWQFNIGAQFDTRIADLPAYARIDYQYKGKSFNGPAQTDANYQAINRVQGSTEYVSARVGVTVKGADVNVFVNNLTNSKDPLNRTQSGGTALLISQYFRPREIGLQVAWRR